MYIPFKIPSLKLITKCKHLYENVQESRKYLKRAAFSCIVGACPAYMFDSLPLYVLCFPYIVIVNLIFRIVSYYVHILSYIFIHFSTIFSVQYFRLPCTKTMWTLIQNYKRLYKLVKNWILCCPVPVPSPVTPVLGSC